MATTPRHRKRHLDELACVHPHAAGLDIGSAEIVVAVRRMPCDYSVPEL